MVSTLCTAVLCTTLGVASYAQSAAAATSQHNVAATTASSAQYRAGYSGSFTIGGAVEHPATYTLAGLRTFAATKENVVFLTGAGPLNASFTGVLLWDLISAAVPKVDPKIKNDVLRKGIVVTGSDGYKVALSLGEIAPAFGGQQVLVAYAQDGHLLGPDAGFARIIFPGDKFGGRDVFNVVRIDVVST